MSEATYVPCPHCGHPYPMSAMQKELYRGRTLSCNNCARPFSADQLTPIEMPAPRPAPAERPAQPATVAPPVQAPGGRRTGGWTVALGSVGAAAAVVFLIALVLLPPLNRAREQANRVKCASNMRQIGQAIFIYASVNAGQFPDRLDRLLPYAGSASFVCPSGTDTPAPGPTPQIQASNLYARGHLSYVYVGAGLNTNSGLGASANTAVLYEPISDHRDGINVLYADGAVNFLPATAAQALIASLAPAATQPTTQPSAAALSNGAAQPDSAPQAPPGSSGTQ